MRKLTAKTVNNAGTTKGKQQATKQPFAGEGCRKPSSSQAVRAPHCAGRLGLTPLPYDAVQALARLISPSSTTTPTVRPVSSDAPACSPVLGEPVCVRQQLGAAAPGRPLTCFRHVRQVLKKACFQLMTAEQQPPQAGISQRHAREPQPPEPGQQQDVRSRLQLSLQLHRRLTGPTVITQPSDAESVELTAAAEQQTEPGAEGVRVQHGGLKCCQLRRARGHQLLTGCSEGVLQLRLAGAVIVPPALRRSSVSCCSRGAPSVVMRGGRSSSGDSTGRPCTSGGSACAAPAAAGRRRRC